MPSPAHKGACLLAAALFAGCVFEPNSLGPTDFGVVDDTDAQTVDARPADAELDAGALDTGELDSGAIDSGNTDAVPTDTLPVDASPPDTGPDATPMDATPMDADPPDAEMDAGVIDTGFDAGTPDTGAGPDGGFPYVPSNTPAPGLAVPIAWALNSGLGSDTCTLDTGTSGYSGSGCGNPRPIPEMRTLLDATPVMVLSVSSLLVARQLSARGPNPLIILVYGDAQIASTIDVGANNIIAGPGSNRANCIRPVPLITALLMHEAGGGGGFGQAGGNGGFRTPGTQMGGIGGSVSGNDTLVPLQGGCPGGNSTNVVTGLGAGGGGGGAIQISVAGELELTSLAGIFSAGGGGQGGRDNDRGGAGGGSGGAILLEAQSFVLDAPLFAGGGGGGGGADNDSVFTSGDDGDIVDPNPANGSAGDPMSGGDGGRGGVAPRGGDLAPEDGEDVNTTAGGGGGGGGAGRIRVNVYGTPCTLTRRIWTGVLTSLPSACSF